MDTSWIPRARLGTAGLAIAALLSLAGCGDDGGGASVDQPDATDDGSPDEGAGDNEQGSPDGSDGAGDAAAGQVVVTIGDDVYEFDDRWTEATPGVTSACGAFGEADEGYFTTYHGVGTGPDGGPLSITAWVSPGGGVDDETQSEFGFVIVESAYDGEGPNPRNVAQSEGWRFLLADATGSVDLSGNIQLTGEAVDGSGELVDASAELTGRC